MAKKKDTQTQELFTQPAVPKMPEGFYSGDKPNPKLRAFVEQHLHEKPYDPASDNYKVSGFSEAIDVGKRKSSSMDLHIYWSKKPHDAVRQYIRHFTAPNDLVLDPFSGSGSTALAALMESRKVVAIDRSPAATFITKNYCTSMDVGAFQQAFEQVGGKVKAEIDWLYDTKCDRCGGKATTCYTAFSQIFECPRCLTKLALFDCSSLESKTANGKSKSISICPHCEKKGHSEEISTRSTRFGSIPVLVSYVCESGCKPARAERRHNDADLKKREFFQKYDLAKIQEIEAKETPHWYPRHRMMNVESDDIPWGDEWREGRNFRTVAELFTKRNLWALGAIRSACLETKEADFLLFALNTAILTVSKMCRHDWPSVMAGTYYIPQINRELNVWDNFSGRVPRKAEGVAEIWQVITSDPKIIVSTESATKLTSIPSDSVDYIFTDPPYAEKVQYGELNFIWEAWLNLDTKWHDEEIIVNGVRGRTADDWKRMMQLAVSECFRVLKPGRWLSLCYHDTAEGTWSLVQEIMLEAGFVTDETGAVLYIDSNQKSFNQLNADKVTKRDLIINFRKPKPGEERSAVQFTGAEDQQSFREKAQTVIREYLQANPGATKDRIYDQVVSRLVRLGQMEAHNFDELLGQVAEEVKEEVKKNLFENEEPDLLGTHQISRWHLKESEAGADDAEQATTDSAGTRIHEFLTKTTTAKLAGSEPKVVEFQAEIAARRTKLQAVDQNESDESRGKLVREIRELKEKLDKLTAQRAEWQQQALDYSQIFEFYVAAVNPKPKARLEEILEDYGYQTDAGNWRPPLTEQEKLEKGSERQQAVRRKIQRFCKLLEAGDGITAEQRPDAQTLAEWIRHCRRTGSYAQGKLLYERGGLDTNALNEQAQVDVEEDYQVCVKHLERGKK